MSLLRNLLLGVLLLSLVVFIALFGQLPALRRTPVGWLQRALCLHIPNGLRRVDTRLTGGTITRSSRRLGHYLFYQKNPIVLILFLFLLTGATTIFLTAAIPRLPTSLLLPIPLLVSLPYLFTYLSATHTAHRITPATHRHFYPYDRVLFHPGHTCSTCRLPKPARSKHCSLCGTCIAMADHHCPWINNCVGRGNYRHFLLLLLSLGALELYGACLAHHLLQPWLTYNRHLPLLSAARWADTLTVSLHALQRGGLAVAGVGLLAATTFPLPWGLLAYHAYLIWAGMTTNESQKWADWRDDMADGVVFKARLSALQAHNRRRPGNATAATTTSNPALNSAADDELPIPWPVHSDQILVRTRDGRPPTGQEALWTRVWDLADVDNIYDLGGWDNLLEILRGR